MRCTDACEICHCFGKNWGVRMLAACITGKYFVLACAPKSMHITSAIATFKFGFLLALTPGIFKRYHLNHHANNCPSWNQKKNQHHHLTPFTSTTSTFATCLRQKNCPSDWPILTKSSSINPREVIAGVPTRRPLGFIALLGWKTSGFLLETTSILLGGPPGPATVITRIIIYNM